MERKELGFLELVANRCARSLVLSVSNLDCGIMSYLFVNCCVTYVQVILFCCLVQRWLHYLCSVFYMVVGCMKTGRYVWVNYIPFIHNK